ncbi:MAG: VanZ family protein [Bacilli bacterium]
MFDVTIVNIISNIWPMVVIITVILTSIRITQIMINKEKIILYKELLKFGFIVYIISLFYVVTFQDIIFGTSNFIPFKEVFRYEILSKLFFKNVIGNVIMFIPYGFFISYFLNLNKKKYVFYLCLIVSLTIEVTQLLIGRVFDVDDIMLNILGGFIGYFIYDIINNIKDNLPKIFKKDSLYNFISIVILFGIIFYVSHLLGGI